MNTTTTRRPILPSRDRAGTALMPLGTVYPVQLDPTRATAAVAAQLEKIAEAKPGSLVAKLAAAQQAGNKSPIPVITYREADFQARRTALDALVGVIYPKTQQPLADNRESRNVAQAASRSSPSALSARSCSIHPNLKQEAAEKAEGGNLVRPSRSFCYRSDHRAPLPPI